MSIYVCVGQSGVLRAFSFYYIEVFKPPRDIHNYHLPCEMSDLFFGDLVDTFAYVCQGGSSSSGIMATPPIEQSDDDRLPPSESSLNSSASAPVVQGAGTGLYKEINKMFRDGDFRRYGYGARNRLAVDVETHELQDYGPVSKLLSYLCRVLT